MFSLLLSIGFLAASVSQPCEIIVPNAITPNNCKNISASYFQPQTDCPYSLGSMVIFNRWGELIHQTAQLPLTWDVEHTQLPEGVYVYVITYFQKDANNQPQKIAEKKGNVVLIKW